MFKSFCVLLVAFLGFSAANAKDAMVMTPPKPVNNKVMDAMVGTWQGQSNMMGAKMNDTTKISWTLNHQFLLIQLESKAVNDPRNHYEAMGLFGMDRNHKVKVWWFDNWGASEVSTGMGTIQNNKMLIKDGNHMFSEQRTFQVEGNKMLMQAKGVMKMDGKNTAFDQAVTYEKLVS